MGIKEVAQLLEVSDVTIRREIAKGSFGELKKENGEYVIEYHQVLKFISETPKYSKAIVKFVELMGKEYLKESVSLNTDLNIDELEAAVLKSTISNYGSVMVEAFSCFLDKQESQLLPYLLKAVENKLNTTKQPTVLELEKILSDVISVDVHEKIKVGEMLNADQIEEIFGRKPQQEGINFCKGTKELYIITKLGVDNPTVEKAEYNDFWKNGKIYYEGKGQDEFQEFKGSNLHLYRKYQVFNRIIKCKEGVPSYIHVFNRAKIYESEKFQYLGKFYVTDYLIDSHSLGRLQETKTAIVFELTPIVNKSSTSIDDNYVFAN